MRNCHPRLIIAGTHSGAGKTSVVIALLAALCGRNTPVYPFKIGPDYIDPAFHAHVVGVPSRNLDSWLLDASTLRGLFARNACEDGVALIEGVMGLFDGKGATHEGSTAHVAELLNAPVVLVLSALGLSRSAAAMVAGYASFHPGVSVRGVIVNRVKSERQYALIKQSIEGSLGIPCLGYLPEDASLVLRSRHLGLVPREEVPALDAIVKGLGNHAAKTIDLDGLLALAGAAPPLTEGLVPDLEVALPVRLGVARDEAFSFYYQDNFECLTRMGAEIVFFSPMRDAGLPENIHGLYLGGGFPEVFASSLAGNISMREAVFAAAGRGMPIYAECGGMAYVCASLRDAQGREFPMAGVFPHRVAMTEKLHHFGYTDVTFLRHTILGPAGMQIRAHEFHYSHIVDQQIDTCLRMHKDGAASWTGGLAMENVLALYPHIHFYSNPAVARHFLGHCAAFKEATA